MRLRSGVGELNPNYRHGHAAASGSSRTYRIWQAMLNRCRNKKVQQYADYGGRGVTVCERWLAFPQFLADMGEATQGMSLDRIDNDGNYEPNNCRWATARQQRLNSRAARKISFRGKTQTIDEWAKERGIKYMTLYSRLVTYGWSPARALS